MEVLNDAQLKDLINSPGPRIEDAAKTLPELELPASPNQDGSSSFRVELAMDNTLM